MDSLHHVLPPRAFSALSRPELEALLIELIGKVAELEKVVGAQREEIARLMADYNLTAAAVCDAEERMIGVVTVDDVLEVLLPKGWRRRFGLLGED